MARAYGKVLVTIWRDEEFRALPATAQRLYLYFISSPDLSSAGVLPMRVSKWAKAATDLISPAVRDDLDCLREVGFVLVDDETEEVMVRSFIKNDEGYRTPNMRKAIHAAIDSIESRDLREHADAALAALHAGTHTPTHSGTHTPTHSDGIPNNSSQQPSPTTTPAAAAAASKASVNGSPAASAVELVVMHRLTNPDPNNPIRSAAKYAERIRNDTMRELGDALNAAEWPDDEDAPRWLAVNVLGLTRDEAARAAGALLRKRNGRAA